ncbi:hypothetical protein EDB83DRAFT_2679649 [Lactarius deliciosus]|nr:hypothetical protein EDB83DRAFT_2679649 [Lactarius deliciosus]
MSESRSTTVTSSPGTSLPDLLGASSLLHADIILRSSDSHDFRVQRFYVVDSSPVLRAQIMAVSSTTRHGVGPGLEATSKASETTTVDSEANDKPLLPVIQLAESHTIISALLTFVFPVPPVLPPTIEQILELLSVAQKYEMTTALIRIRDCASRREPSFICPETALQVLSLSSAHKYGLLEETRQAAEETLKSPMTIQDFEDKLDIMPGATLSSLWKYRQRVLANLAVSLHEEFYESELGQILVGLDCVETASQGADTTNQDANTTNQDANTGTNKIPRWVDTYLNDIEDDLANHNLTTFHLALSSHVSSMGNGCEHCVSIPGKTICDIWAALTAVVHKSIRKATSGILLKQRKTRSQSSTLSITGTLPLPEGLNMQGADVILRSSDLVSFRVHKSILAISSPFWNDLFSLPQPPDGEVVEGIPVVHTAEDAELVHSLLTVLYPIPSVIPDSYEKALALLAASQKYNMTTVLSTVRSEIGRQLPTTEAAAFRAYAIACSKRLIPEIETTARLTLDHPMTFETIIDALPLFEGSALSDLVRFRKRCRDNFVSFFEGFLDGSDNLSRIWSGCRKTKRPFSATQNDKAILARWLRDLILEQTNSLKGAYTNPLPNPSSLREDFVAALRTHVSQTNCPSCPTVWTTEGEAFHEQLNSRILKARDEEPFRLDSGAPTTSVDLGNADA